MNMRTEKIIEVNSEYMILLSYDNYKVKFLSPSDQFEDGKKLTEPYLDSTVVVLDVEISEAEE